MTTPTVAGSKNKKKHGEGYLGLGEPPPASHLYIVFPSKRQADTPRLKPHRD